MALDFTSNVGSMFINRNLYGATAKANKALEKLSSGLRINSGKDDPSGLVISELLRSQISGYTTAIRNTQEANNVLSIAEGGLGSMQSILTKMKGLALHALNSGVTSDMQVQADQMELNAALSAFQQISSTTSYSNTKLLDGTNDFTFSTNDPSGMLNQAGTSIKSVSGMAGNEIAIGYSGNPADQAEKAYMEADFGGATLATNQEFSLVGKNGSQSFTFAAGTSISDMASQINQATGSTGVSAYAIRDNGSGATALRLVSSDYGAQEFVKVEQRTGDAFAAAGTTAVDYGKNASLSVNGEQVTTNGLNADISTNNFTGTLAFKAGTPTATTIAQTGYNQDTLSNATAANQSSLSNIRNGMQLQLGESAGGQSRERISIGSFDPANIGRVTVDDKTYSLSDLYGGGAASLANNPEIAMKVINQAITDVSNGRAQIGAYQSQALQTNANALAIAVENVTATESSIRDTDMAMAMTDLVQAQILRDFNLRNAQSQNMMNRNVAKLLNLGG